MWLLGLSVLIIVVFLLMWTLDKIKLNPQNRYILITGCDSGFGNVLARNLDKKGCHVFATCLTSAGAESLTKVSSARLHAMIMDVSNSESIQVAFEVVDKVLIDKPGLWGLVNNAGILGNGGYYEWSTRDEFRRVLEVNLLGPIEVTNVFSPLLRKAKGRIVNMSSGITLAPTPSGGYEMSKCGLEAFSDCLRRQMRHSSVSVHIVQPAFFATNINNANNICDKIEMNWNRMTRSQQDFYGRKCIEELKHVIKESEKGADPRLHLVTDAIEHALLAWSPWSRYPVGILVKIVARLIHVLPAFAADPLTQTILYLPKPQRCR
ncbi:retinol dehydrogenase 16-like [Amphiura filiformis]|uniref:retinol dehydrogenase 16-like n=1 Tax=Amphiura filiformis TaxID=82378 RepID=UPI003B21924D